MPRLRTPAIEMNRRELVAKIKYGMEMQAASFSEVALSARMTEPTLYHRFKKPEDFKLYELLGICKKLRINLSELLDCYAKETPK